MFGDRNPMDCEQYNQLDDREMLTEQEQVEMEETVVRMEYQKVLKKARKGRRGGIDGIPLWIIKQSIEEVQEVVWQVVKEVWEKGEMEEMDTEGLLVLLPKQGRDKTTWKGWRPITMSNIICKIVMAIWTNRVRKVAKDKDWFADSQHGFREKSGCQTACMDIKLKLEKYKQQNKKVAVIKLDISRAFDSVSWEGLQCLFESLGIPEHMQKIFWGSYKGIKVRIQHSDKQDSGFILEHGVKQGGP